MTTMMQLPDPSSHATRAIRLNVLLGRHVPDHDRHEVPLVEHHLAFRTPDLRRYRLLAAELVNDPDVTDEEFHRILQVRSQRDFTRFAREFIDEERPR